MQNKIGFGLLLIAAAIALPKAHASSFYQSPEGIWGDLVATHPGQELLVNSTGQEEIWIDGDTIRALLEQVADKLGPDYGFFARQIKGAKLVQTEKGSKIYLYLVRSVTLRLKDPKDAATGEPYAVSVPSILQLETFYSGSTIVVEGAPLPWRRLGIKVKLPVVPDTIQLRSFALDLENEEAKVIGGAIFSSMPVSASARITDGKPEVGINIFETVVRNLAWVSPWRFSVLVGHK